MSYGGDFYGWAFEQARRVRAGEALDRCHIAEELEDLGRHEQRLLTRRLARLMQHLLKIERQPQKHTRSWDLTVKEQRRQANKILKENPSLWPKLAECVADAYLTAVYKASLETGLAEEDFPAACPYTAEYLLDGR